MSSPRSKRSTKRPSLSTASALNAAFAALGARRLVFLSETKQAGHDKKLAYLREAGYDIVAEKAGEPRREPTPIARRRRSFWYDTGYGAAQR